jgi:hypothetical protein
MRIKAILILFIALIVAIIGCGGNNEGFRGSTPFTGSWAGTWKTVGTTDLGYMTLSIADNAEMAGTFANVLTGETGRVVGGTHPEGLFNATLIVDGSGEKIALSGIMTMDGSRGPIAGDGTLKRPGGVEQGLTFDLTRDQGTSPFAGSFGADWSTFGTGETGVMNVTIGADGLIRGQFTDATTDETGTILGVVDADGNFTSTWKINGSAVAIEVDGGMTEVGSGTDGQWEGTGTWSRPGQATQGFQFQTPPPTTTTTA